MILVTQSWLEDAERCKLFLRALEEAGVDGWEGYSDAQDFFETLKEEQNI